MPFALLLLRLPRPAMNSFYIHTFGCQMNVHDSQRMSELLRAAGLSPVDSAETADLVVVNTCSVRDKAEQKLDSELGKLRRLKKNRANPPVLVVAGCVASQRAEAMLARMPFIDVVLGPDNLNALPKLAFAAANGAPPVVATDFDIDEPTFLRSRPETTKASVTAYVSISKGCDERCSFCIVPSTRGPERHRSASEIIGEIRDLVEAGTKEVILLGQTVNGYKDPTGELHPRAEGAPSDFASLLHRIARDVPSLTRMRYTSPHPRYFDDALATAHRDVPMLCRHVHMPLQSGSDDVLRRMIRRHDLDDYRASVRALRRAQPDLTVSTDLIVGFPGETDEDFELTLAAMREIGFVGVYAFKYSPRPGTPALRLGDDVSTGVKSERLARVFELSEALTAQHLATLVGTTQQVLIEEPNPRGDGGLSGHTDRNEIVHVGWESGLRVGDGIVPIRITRAYKHSLVGEVDRTRPEGLPEGWRRRLPVAPRDRE